MSAPTYGCQVRGFWMAPYLNKEAADRGKVLADVMQYLADGVVVPHSGAPFCRQCKAPLHSLSVQGSFGFWHAPLLQEP